jgi:hypothetical protein
MGFSPSIPPTREAVPVTVPTIPPTPPVPVPVTVAIPSVAQLWTKAVVNILVIGIAAGWATYSTTGNWQKGVGAGLVAALTALTQRLSTSPFNAPAVSAPTTGVKSS